jgi:imidazolonepropionase-like amidohydrolase
MVDDATRARFLQARRTILKQMIDAGVPFLLGSDAPQIWNIPGYSVRRELDALVAAGFTPWQALASGTTNVARFLGVEALAGTVETGKRADLILLDGNPLTDIANVGRQAGVMVKGAWYPATEVERRLAALRLQ